MARPAKKPVARKAPAKPKAAAKASAKVSASDRSGATPYTPKPIEGVGWPAFRYPL
jgi:hypothetical protein